VTPGQLDCREALALLVDYLKTELTPDNASRVAAHLSACGHCLEQAQFEQNFRAALERAAGGVRCPEELLARIRAALRDAGGA